MIGAKIAPIVRSFVIDLLRFSRFTKPRVAGQTITFRQVLVKLSRQPKTFTIGKLVFYAHIKMLAKAGILIAELPDENEALVTLAWPDAHQRQRTLGRLQRLWR